MFFGVIQFEKFNLSAGATLLIQIIVGVILYIMLSIILRIKPFLLIKAYVFEKIKNN